MAPGSIGSNLLASNPFAAYNLANLRKEGDDDEGDSKDEEEKEPEPETVQVKEQLEPSPYTKLVTVNLKIIVA